MANPEHLEILKRGVEGWNNWREEHPDIEPDLSAADLQNMDLKGANFKLTNLRGANLEAANFSLRPKGDGTYTRAILSGSDLSHASLNFSNLTFAELIYTNLARANLDYAILRAADLRHASLVYAEVFNVDFTHAFLQETDFSHALLDSATFGNNYLAETIGLDVVEHIGPSFLGINTLYRSANKIPKRFLVGCGVPDEFITYLPSLLGAQQAIQFYSCFISYSTRDEEFARRLYSRMRDEKLRVWFAPEDVKGGEKLFEQIERAIQVHDRLLIVLSENSLRSKWVMTEIRRARKVELRENRRKLFPIRLVDYETLQAWECFDADTGEDLATEVRQYFIPDFSNWKDHDAFEKAFDRLLRDLRAEENSKPSYMTPNSLERRAVLSPRDTIREAWDEVESLIVQAGRCNGLVNEGDKYVDCSDLIRELYETGKLSEETKEKYFNLSKEHRYFTGSDLVSVDATRAINFAEQARELKQELNSLIVSN
jgi:hypothetical protein